MTIRLESAKRRFIFELHAGVLVRVPLVGQVHYSRATGLTWDGWRTLRAAGEV